MSAPTPATVIVDGRIVENEWLSLADDAALPASGKVIVSLKRFRAERAVLDGSGLAVGVRIPNTEDVATLARELAGQPLIAVEIPKMADGRAYSQARVLRERYAYRGEIRAQGDVMHDLLFNMARCGINAFELRADQDAQDCLRAFADFDLAYQQAADGIETVLQRRRRLAA
ncbi:DUF934 domain-containing protein [Nevskia soli]|uniref:DUF934 domain-containing protein n=1 Tax=Nevskia soli TaxID=418856 RepID=UPI00055D056E|nr:DUF934 domain-containing protein [Nevskia soli]